MFFEYGGVTFEWDDDKADLVYSKRKISFEECCSVMFDERGCTQEDEREYGEQRYITVGMSNQARLLVVVWTQRGDKIRVITAVKPSKTQIAEYQNG